MRTTYTIPVRVFPVKVRDERTGEELTDSIVLDKPRLQAAQLVGQSSKELIFALYNRRGFRVLEIGKARKTAVTVDLSAI